MTPFIPQQPPQQQQQQHQTGTNQIIPPQNLQQQMQQQFQNFVTASAAATASASINGGIDPTTAMAQQQQQQNGGGSTDFRMNPFTGGFFLPPNQYQEMMQQYLQTLMLQAGNNIPILPFSEVCVSSISFIFLLLTHEKRGRA